MKRIIITLFLLLLFTNTILSQESEQPVKKRESRNSWIMLHLSDQDVILTLSSIEWGTPDRWSITSRYIHGFEKERKRITWRNSVGISLSPGLSGGRLGVGYLGIYSPASMKALALISELRGVLLRTWGNPLSTSTNSTLVGAEVKICLSWLINVSAGYYSPITSENIKSFWGFHFGI